MKSSNKGSIYAQSWSKLKKDKAAMLGLFVILFTLVISILGGNIRPDPSPFANDGVTAIGRLKTNSTIKVLKVRQNKKVEKVSFFGKLLMGGQRPTHATVPIIDYRFEADEVIVTLYSSSQTIDQEKHFLLADVCFPILKNNKDVYQFKNNEINYRNKKTF